MVTRYGHAGLATQAKVEAGLREQGISRYDLGRESLLIRSGNGKKNMQISFVHSG